MAMDPMDEFEFKPITEGLGFHKKAEKIKADVRSSSGQAIQEKLGRSIPDVPPGQRAKGDAGGSSLKSRSDTNSSTNQNSSGIGASFADQLSSQVSQSSSSAGLFGGGPSFSGGGMGKGSSGVSNQASSLSDLASSLGLNDEPFSTRPSATQSISDLIASLPPSLDFIEDKPASRSLAGTLAESAGGQAETDKSRPQIFQPLGRDDYSGAGATIGSRASAPPRQAALAAPTSSTTGHTIGTALGHSLGHGGSSAGGAASGSHYLPAPGSKAAGGLVAPVAAGAAVTPASPYRGRLDESFARAFPHADKSKRESTETELETERETGLVPVACNLVGAVLDAMVASGLATILLVAIMAITHINLMGLLTHADTQLSTILNLVGLFLVVNTMYLLIARIFVGASLGEWAFDLQMGNDEDRQSIAYFFKILWRLALVSMTGLVLLPLISFIAGRDLIRPLTGLQLYRRS